MKKKFGIILTLILLTLPVFATTTVKSNDVTIDLSFIQNAVNLIVGVFAGGYCVLKAALDVFHAVRNASEDQNAMKRAIGSFILNVAILGGFMFVINFVFGSMSSVNNGDDIKDMTAQQVFFGALSGALVNL